MSKVLVVSGRSFIESQQYDELCVSLLLCKNPFYTIAHRLVSFVVPKQNVNMGTNSDFDITDSLLSPSWEVYDIDVLSLLGGVSQVIIIIDVDIIGVIAGPGEAGDTLLSLLRQLVYSAVKYKKSVHVCGTVQHRLNNIAAFISAHDNAQGVATWGNLAPHVRRGNKLADGGGDTLATWSEVAIDLQRAF